MLELKTIREVLRERDGSSEEEITEKISIARNELRAAMKNGTTASATLEDMDNILMNHLGLEPDYLFDDELAVL